jgi:citrate synthase
MSAHDTWKTGITDIGPNKIFVRGALLDEMMGKVSFAQAVYLLLKGKMPTQAEARVMDAILVSSIDHGITPHSTIVARNAAACGAPMAAALAAGILSNSKVYSGAVAGAMEAVRAVLEKHKKDKKSLESAAKEVVNLVPDKKLPGFGHRVHGQDPRAVRLLEIAKEEKLSGDFCKAALALEEALLVAHGKKTPMNVDGATAAVLLEMGFSTELGNAFFVISRIPGLIAHIHEEQKRERPMRTIQPSKWEYDGPEHL